MIQIKKTTISTGEAIEISIFASHNEALSQICDPVLTRPESQLWSILLGKYRQVVDPTEDRELNKLAVAFWEGEENESLQNLYDGYSEAVTNDLHSACRYSWYWIQNHYEEIRYFGIGLHGIRVVWAMSTVVSAMLPSDENGKPNRSVSYHDRLTNPPPRRSSKQIPKVFRAATDRNQFEIFKNSWRSVRNEYLTAFKEKNAKSRCAQFTERQTIPFHEWQELRTQNCH